MRFEMECSPPWLFMVTPTMKEKYIDRARRAEARGVTAARNNEEERENSHVRRTRSEEGLDPSEGDFPLEDDRVGTRGILQATNGHLGLDEQESDNLRPRMNEEDGDNQIPVLMRSIRILCQDSRVPLATWTYESLPWKEAGRGFSIILRKWVNSTLQSSPIKKIQHR